MDPSAACNWRAAPRLCVHWEWMGKAPVCVRHGKRCLWSAPGAERVSNGCNICNRRDGKTWLFGVNVNLDDSEFLPASKCCRVTWIPIRSIHDTLGVD